MTFLIKAGMRQSRLTAQQAALAEDEGDRD